MTSRPTNHDLLTHVLHAIHQLDEKVTQIDRRLTRFETQTQHRLGVLRRLIMATVEEMTALFDAQAAAQADYISDVTITLADLSTKMAAMQAAIDASGASAAVIADLTAKNVALQSGVDSIATRSQAMTDALAAADAAVQPAP